MVNMCRKRTIMYMFIMSWNTSCLTKQAECVPLNWAGLTSVVGEHQLRTGAPSTDNDVGNVTQP